MTIQPSWARTLLQGPLGITAEQSSAKPLSCTVGEGTGDRPLLLTLPVGNQPSAPSRDSEPPSREETGANEANTNPYPSPFSHPSLSSAWL